jgi:hypothetical protein
MKDGVDEGMNEGINGVCVVCVCVCVWINEQGSKMMKEGYGRMG